MKGEREEHKETLRNWLLEAMKAHGGNASIVEVCKYVWENHEEDLRGFGDMFFTWQCDIRWIADDLRKEGVFSGDLKPRGMWKLVRSS
jgi:hypothetical protein